MAFVDELNALVQVSSVAVLEFKLWKFVLKASTASKADLLLNVGGMSCYFNSYCITYTKK